MLSVPSLAWYSVAYSSWPTRQGRFERWPLWWGASNLLLGFGCFGVALRDIAPDFVSVGLANSLTLAGYVALLIAIRVFADERINFLYYGVFVIVGSLPAFLIFDGGASYLPRIAYLSIIFCCCDLAIMREGLRLVRREKLVSGWILVGLFLPTALIFAGRAVLAPDGSVGWRIAYLTGQARINGWRSRLPSSSACAASPLS